jgi:hypothetical protein
MLTPPKPPPPTVALMRLIVEVFHFPLVAIARRGRADIHPCRQSVPLFLPREVDCKSHTLRISELGAPVPSYRFAP